MEDHDLFFLILKIRSSCNREGYKIGCSNARKISRVKTRAHSLVKQNAVDMFICHCPIGLHLRTGFDASEERRAQHACSILQSGVYLRSRYYEDKMSSLISSF